MTSHELLHEGVAILAQRPDMATVENINNLRIAARLLWEREEMGGLEHVQFAYRNGTPIVPVGHRGHPIELRKRGYIDGKGWPANAPERKITLHKWPDGNHWYAFVDGVEVVEGGRHKWNTQEQAIEAANRFTPAEKGQQ